MFGKLLILVLALALAGAMLLVMRQHRVESAYRMSTLHRELLRQEQALWDARRAVAEAVRPDAIRALLAETNQAWTPLTLDTDRLLHAATLAPPPPPDADAWIAPRRGEPKPAPAADDPQDDDARAAD